jgi:hypothetical protein
MPPRFVSTDHLNAAIERVMPDVLALLGDGVPRTSGSLGTSFGIMLMNDERSGRSPCRGAGGIPYGH